MCVKKRDAVFPEFRTEHNTIQVVTVVTGLSHPWSPAFLPSQDPKSDAGMILHLQDDGSAPEICRQAALSRRSVGVAAAP